MGGGRFLLLALVTFLGACSQGRRGIGNNGPQDQVWGAMSLCAVPRGDLLGCFDISINISENVVYLEPKQLGFNPSQIPYRVLARHYKEQAFVVLGTGIRTGVGDVIELSANGSDKISDYAEWRVEWAIGTYNGIDWFESSPGSSNAKLVATATTNWPELQELAYYTGTSSRSSSSRYGTSR